MIRHLAIASLLLGQLANAQEKPPAQVLFLGDAHHGTIVRSAAAELGAQVKVTYATAAIDSGSALARIDELLGDTKWDIIYFNFGFGDLFYKDPATREIRVMSKDAGGVRVSTPEQYEKNLNALGERLKATRAKVIWGSTTPMVQISHFPHDLDNVYDINAEVETNTIAARVMATHNIPVVDLHGYIMARFGPDEKHPPYVHYAKEMEARGHPLHAPVVKAFRDAMSLIGKD